MKKLTRDDLYSLEQYAEQRPAFRARVLAHKKNRKVHLGENATLYFEDALTVQYQIQEMLRVERLFSAGEIEDELGAYNPLIPDGQNLKATFMLEFEDVEERRPALAALRNIEHRVWVQVEGFEPVFAIADEDMDRSSEDKTSAVHFLRFELSVEMIAALRSGATLGLGSDHAAYRQRVVPLPDNVRASLIADLDPAGASVGTLH